MSSSRNSEVQNCLKIFIQATRSMSILSLITKSILALVRGLSSFESPLMHFMIPGLILLYSFFLSRVSSKPVLYKKVLILLGAECFILYIKKVEMSHYDQRTAFTMLATTFMIIFQIKVLSSMYTIIPLILKHIFVWSIYEIFQSELNQSLDPIVSLSLLVIVVLLILTANDNLKRVAEAYMYKKSLQQ